MKKVLPQGVWSNVVEIDLTNLSLQSFLENLKKTLERIDLLKDKIVEIKGTSFSDPVVRNLSNVAARNLNETITGSWTFSSPITVQSIGGPNNTNLLINGRNYGVEIRIDEDSNGGDTFRITRGSGGSTTLMLVQNTGNVGIGTTSPTQRLDVSGNIRGTQFISTASTGTAPFQVSSTTKVTNLNADLLDGYDTSTSSAANTVAVRDSSGNISANKFISTVATGTAPFQVSSTTLVTNLNADLLDGYDSSSNPIPNTIALRDDSGRLTAQQFFINRRTLTITDAPKWVRFAQSPSNASNNFGLFEIRWTMAGVHGHILVAIGANFSDSNSKSNINVLSRSEYAYWGPGVSKIRLLKKGTYDQMYLEVYVENGDTTRPLTLEIIQLQGYGWSMIDLVNGSIPTGYTENVITATSPFVVGKDDNSSLRINYDGRAGIGTLSPSEKLEVSGNVKASRFISTANTGTPPLQVSSNTLVTNLNADLLDGYDSATGSTPNTVAIRNPSGNLSANSFVSTAPTGIAPLQVSSTTKVTNLNADLLDGYDSSTSTTANTVAVRDSNGNISANSFVSTASTGTAPFQVSSTTRVTNLNADLLDGYDSTDFARKAENATITGNWTFLSTTTFNAGLTISGGVGTWTSSGWTKALDLFKGQALVWRTSGGLAIGLGVSSNILYFSSSTVDNNSAPASYPIVFDMGNGRIGLGTTTPAEKIDVRSGNIRVDSNALIKFGDKRTINVYVDHGGDPNTRYYYLGRVHSGAGILKVQGIMGGHTWHEGRANVDLQFSYRDGFRADGEVIGRIGQSDIYVYAPSGDSYIYIYLVTSIWALVNLELSASGAVSIEFNETYTTVPPTFNGNTIPPIFRLSTDTSNILRIDNNGNTNIVGNLSVAGTINGNLNGNSSTATRLQTARNISLGGSLSGITSFDGSSDVVINASINAGAVGTTQIADGAVTSSKLASGAVIGNLGYVPVNKAGDTMTGTLVLTHTTPLQVTNNTLITNLNADLVDSYHVSTGSTANTVAARDSSGNISANRFISTVSTGIAPLQVSSTTKVDNLNADLLDGYDSTAFPRKNENATITGSWTFTNTISAGNASATIGTLNVNNNANIRGQLIMENGHNAVVIKENSSDINPVLLGKLYNMFYLSCTTNEPIRIHRGTASGQADLEIFKETGSGELPIYLRFHQGYRHWEAIKATNGLISFVNGNDTGFVDIQAKRVTATQDLVVAGNTIANSSGIPYTPLPALGNRGRDILVDRIAVWGDGMYPFALDLYKSDGWFTIPRLIYYGCWGSFINGSVGPRSNTTRVLRMYIVGVDNARDIYDPTNEYWNNGYTTGVPWIRLIKGSNVWNRPLEISWGGSPDTKVYVIEIPTSFLDSYFQLALGIWWDYTSPSWPSANISGDTIPNNYQNYGTYIQWTIYQIWFEMYDRY